MDLVDSLLALGPEVTHGGFERLCLTWLSVISERDHGWMGRPPQMIEFSQKI